METLPRFEVMLEKKSRGRSLLSFSNWKTRTFVLTSQSLEYFDGESSKSTIEIADSATTALSPAEADNKKYPFQLLLSSGEVMKLNASSDTIRQKCINTFNMAAINRHWEYVMSIRLANPQALFAKSILAMHTPEALQIKNSMEDLARDGTCINCKREKASILYQPCNHQCICRSCGTKRHIGVCPLCAEPITQTVTGDVAAIANLKKPHRYSNII